MANPLRRMVSSSQVSDWFKTDGTFTIPSRIPLLDVQYLVIAGGGGGAGGRGAGGGAGGYRSSVTSESSGGGASAESALTVVPNTNYTVTVGAGGAGPAIYTESLAALSWCAMWCCQPWTH